MKLSRSRAAVAAACITVVGASAAHAHHSFAAMYDAHKPVRLVGTLSRVEWTNPHAHFYLNVKGKDGAVTAWVCEGAGPNVLSKRGFRKTDIKAGDTLIVDGYLARSGAKIIDARRVTLPTGRVVAGGSADDGGPDPTATTPKPR
jgi:hypothetical protein